MEDQSRRNFLLQSLKGATLSALAMTGINDWAKAAGNADAATSPSLNCFDQQPLPYAYDALEDVIDAKTMELHYSKHAAAYSKNAREAAIAENIIPNISIDEILATISGYSTKLRNNAGGHYNHEMFWQCMRAKTVNNKPSGKLLETIEKTFGSFATFKLRFADAAKSQFGSGWAWLYKDKNGQLKTGNTPNQDNPLMNLPGQLHQGTPLLCLDVWEHAYYLKYQNRRAEYIEKWWELVNWEYVQKRLDSN